MVTKDELKVLFKTDFGFLIVFIAYNNTEAIITNLGDYGIIGLNSAEDAIDAIQELLKNAPLQDVIDIIDVPYRPENAPVGTDEALYAAFNELIQQQTPGISKNIQQPGLDNILGAIAGALAGSGLLPGTGGGGNGSQPAPEKDNTLLIVGIIGGTLLLIGIVTVVILVATKKK